MKIRPLVLVSLGFSLFNTALQAAILNTQELPASIESCLSNGSCSVDQQSAHDVNGISAFHYENGSFSGYLFRYDLHQPSAAIDAWQQIDFSNDPPTITSHNSNTPLAGNVWLQVAERYNDLSAYHQVTLFLENAQPSDQVVLSRGAPDEFPKTLNFGLTNTALQNAHADKFISLQEVSSLESGDLQINEPILICLSVGCGIEHQLNLIGMQFNPVGNEWLIQFSNDPRGLLYSERHFFNGNEQFANNQRSFYVQPVPLLPSGWLLFSGLAMLLVKNRKKQSA